MDADLKDFLDGMRTEIKGELGRLESHIKINADTSLEHHERTRRHLELLNNHVSALWRKVNGSDPPPNTNGGLPPVTSHPPKALDEKITDHDLALAAVESRVITTNDKVDEVRKDVAGLKEEVQKELRAQSKAMGLERSGFSFLLTREGMKSTGTVIAALTGLLTAFGTWYALTTGRLPMPQNPIQPQVVHEAPSSSSR